MSRKTTIREVRRLAEQLGLVVEELVHRTRHVALRLRSADGRRLLFTLPSDLGDPRTLRNIESDLRKFSLNRPMRRLQTCATRSGHGAEEASVLSALTREANRN